MNKLKNLRWLYVSGNKNLPLFKCLYIRLRTYIYEKPL